jgi:tetratricopeptide (TPR) repeat protein
LGNLGLAYSALGQVEKAIDYYEQALAIAREIGHRQGEGNRLGALGLAYNALGQVEKARNYLEHSLAIFEEIKSPNADLVRRWLAELD